MSGFRRGRHDVRRCRKNAIGGVGNRRVFCRNVLAAPGPEKLADFHLRNEDMGATLKASNRNRPMTTTTSSTKRALPASLEEFKKRRRPLRDYSKPDPGDVKPLDKLAVWITERVWYDRVLSGHFCLDGPRLSAYVRSLSAEVSCPKSQF
jgi:hypothetical protein